jgi:hypothetical protein
MSGEHTPTELIARATEAFGAYRGLGRAIVDEMIAALTETAAERDRLRAEKAELVAVLKELADYEQRYRASHDQRGSGHIQTGRLWDAMRRAGDHARAALAKATATEGGE